MNKVSEMRHPLVYVSIVSGSLIPLGVAENSRVYTVFQKNPCDYVFDDNLNSKRPIVIIFGTVIT